MKSLETKLKELGSDEQFKNKLRTTPVQEFGDRNVITEMNLKVNGVEGATQLNGGYFERHEDNSIVPTDLWIKNNGESDLLSDIIAQIEKKLTPWIIGEYKWVEAGTKMPKGWKLVDTINEGETLVYGGNHIGHTYGYVGRHTHPLGVEEPSGWDKMLVINGGRNAWWTNNHWIKVGATDRMEGPIGDWNMNASGTTKYNWIFRKELDTGPNEVSEGNSLSNRPGGLYALLYIYTGEGV